MIVTQVGFEDRAGIVSELQAMAAGNNKNSKKPPKKKVKNEIEFVD